MVGLSISTISPCDAQCSNQTFFNRLRNLPPIGPKSNSPATPPCTSNAGRITPRLRSILVRRSSRACESLIISARAREPHQAIGPISVNVLTFAIPPPTELVICSARTLDKRIVDIPLRHPQHRVIGGISVGRYGIPRFL